MRFVNFEQSLMYLHLMRFVQIMRKMQLMQKMLIKLSLKKFYRFLHNQPMLIRLNFQHMMRLMRKKN